MKSILILAVSFILLIGHTHAQKIAELYSQRDYKALIKHAGSESLTAEERYYIGYAYFQLEDDAKAIKMYDRAIKKGLDADYIYLYKGLSLRYDKQYDKAIENFRLAVQRNPKGQKNYTELANSYYFQEQYDSALVYFYKAREQQYELGDPYLKLPNIYHLLEKFDKALEEYQKSASLIDKRDPIYVDLLKNIGVLEYTSKKNYPNAIKAYQEMLTVAPTKYNLYSKLIKAYYANEDFTKGDSVFNILKVKYENQELPEDMMGVSGEVVDEFAWDNHHVSCMKYYKKPEEFAEPIYQFFIFDENNKKCIKKILTEKTLGDIDGVKHLLCGINKETGTHATYPIGWKTDDIEYKKLKEYAIMILDGKMKPTASSNFGK